MKIISYTTLITNETVEVKVLPTSTYDQTAQDTAVQYFQDRKESMPSWAQVRDMKITHIENVWRSEEDGLAMFAYEIYRVADWNHKNPAYYAICVQAIPIEEY